MQVIATKEGYDGQVRRNPGEEFEMPDGSKGTWFKPVKDEADKPKGKAGKDEADKPNA